MPGHSSPDEPRWKAGYQTWGTENEFITVIRPVLLSHLSRLHPFPPLHKTSCLKQLLWQCITPVIKGLFGKQTAHPSSATSLLHTATKERTENSLPLGHTEDGFCWPSSSWHSLLAGGGGLQRSGCEMTQLSSLITVTGKVANTEGRKGKHRPPCARVYPVHNWK